MAECVYFIIFKGYMENIYFIKDRIVKIDDLRTLKLKLLMTHSVQKYVITLG